MEPGRRRAAEAVEARRGFLELKQSDFGIDPKSYRAFMSGEHWPSPRTRAKIEVKLGWPVGTIAKLSVEPAVDNLAGLAQVTDDPDERALLASRDLNDGQKRRLIARLWAEEKFPVQQGEAGEQAASQDA